MQIRVSHYVKATGDNIDSKTEYINRNKKYIFGVKTRHPPVFKLEAFFIHILIN